MSGPPNPASGPVAADIDGMDYRAPWWLPGGHAQTIWPALLARRPPSLPGYRRERWDTPDGDFVDVDWLVDQAAAQRGPVPLLALFHGLEGSSRSHYARALAAEASARGWAFAVPHFRGCSGEINRAPRAYHSGDYQEIGWMLQQLRTAHRGPLLAVGVSLGGNALMRWAGEAGGTAGQWVQAVAAVSAPLDLAAGGHALGRGFGRQVYTRAFLVSMRPKALRKWEQHPGLFDRAAVRAARDLYAFDNAFTAPLHGFRDTADYWARASAKPHLHRVRVPALVVNAQNDPFVPAASLPRPGTVGPCVTLWQPAGGGHAGFPAGALPGHRAAMPKAICRWLAQHLV